MTCVWTPDADTLSDGKWSDYDLDEQARALLLASSSLVSLTYGRVGACPITIRPCPEPLPGPCCSIASRWRSNTARAGFVPFMGTDGLWYNQACGCRLSCRPISEFDIPGPVGYISAFKIDGEDVLASDTFDRDWRLDDGHLLVWQGSTPSPLPSSQDLNLPDTEVGTWSLTYSRSYPVLKDGEIAVAALALEFAKGLGGKGKCALPRGVTNVVRNGVSFTIQAGLFPNGLTGIEVVDQYILKWAPAGMPSQPAQVFDPSTFMARPRRTNTVPRKAV